MAWLQAMGSQQRICHYACLCRLLNVTTSTTATLVPAALALLSLVTLHGVKFMLLHVQYLGLRCQDMCQCLCSGKAANQL
jgi:hypothetical protein